MVELFKRSEEKYDVKYTCYIGDGDSKTFKAISDAKPYENTAIFRKECIGRAGKRMEARLRSDKKANKGIGGKGKLTAKVISDLTAYYGLAIRRNVDSVENMYNDIWATYHHYSSSDDNPVHDNCPPGPDSWCKWRVAEALDELDTFRHSAPPLPQDVLEILKPIYEELSRRDLLERCLGGNIQNNNESLNSLI